MLPQLGGVEGTRENALSALGDGHLVVCYPGGAKEVFKPDAGKYALRWESSLGFVKVAAEAGVPVVPFAGFGIDDCFAWGSADSMRVKLSDDERYHVPVRLPVPQPAAIRFALGKPLTPPRPGSSERELTSFKDRVAAKVRRLLLKACDA